MKRILNQKVSLAVHYWVFISIYIMGPTNGVVVGCYNITKNLHKWKESNCKAHGV